MHESILSETAVLSGICTADAMEAMRSETSNDGAYLFGSQVRRRCIS